MERRQCDSPVQHYQAAKHRISSIYSVCSGRIILRHELLRIDLISSCHRKDGHGGGHLLPSHDPELVAGMTLAGQTTMCVGHHAPYQIAGAAIVSIGCGLFLT